MNPLFPMYENVLKSEIESSFCSLTGGYYDSKILGIRYACANELLGKWCGGWSLWSNGQSAFCMLR